MHPHRPRRLRHGHLVWLGRAGRGRAGGGGQEEDRGEAGSGESAEEADEARLRRERSDVRSFSTGLSGSTAFEITIL